MNDTSWGRTVFVTIRNDIELRHSLFSALFAAALIHMIYLFSPVESRVSLLLITFPLSIMLPVILCGWRARWNATQASLLGGVFSFSLLGSLSTDSFFWGQFARYCACVAAFHYGEFLATALTNRADLKQSSYLLDHSLAYWAAAAISWCEYWLEVRYLPVLKSVHVGYVGLLLVICGECLRKLAMVHAKGGFTHLVAQTKRPKHKLVTDGVYGLVRHPGYLGWLVWCLGTQVMLCNPFCFVLYSLLGWNFFNERIYWEERYLTCFFGAEYKRYQSEVPLGIPFVSGFQADPPEQQKEQAAGATDD